MKRAVVKNINGAILYSSLWFDEQAIAEQWVESNLSAFPPDANIVYEDSPSDMIAWESLREERNRRLAACDWTQMPDAPLTSEEKSAWATYRQTLRDLPQTTNDPENPIWPIEP